MDAWDWTLLAVAAAAVLVIIGLAVAGWQKQRPKRLDERFGPEDERTVARAGDGRSAEEERRARAKQRERLDIRPLSTVVRDRYAEEWHRIQTRFVDEPDRAVDEADQLISILMREQGYPVDDFEDQAALVSVDHPVVVENYRSAHAIHLRNADRLADADELRQALRHYRSLFDELLA